MIQLFGRPVHYRLEHRKAGESIIFSIQRDWPGAPQGRRRVLIEEAPRKLSRLLRQYKKENGEDGIKKGAMTDGFLQFAAMGFIARAFDLKDPEGKERARTFPQTLGTATVILQKDILYKKNREDYSVKDDDRLLKKLRKDLGDLELGDVCPSPHADILRRHSQHDRDGCVRLLRLIFNRMVDLSVADENPWKDFRFKESLKRVSSDREIKNNIEQRVLTTGQCGLLLKELSSAKKEDPMLLAVILLLTAGISPEELCGLNKEDYTYLDDYRKRAAISIRRTYEPGETNCRLRDIVEKEKIRRLPLPRELNDSFEALMKKGPQEGPMFVQPKNSNRRMTPELLAKEVAKRIKEVEPQKTSSSKRAKPLHGIQLLRNTAFQELAHYGFEPEELRYLKGDKPQLVSAKSYCDFQSEAQLNKMGAIQDRWVAACIIPGDFSRPVSKTGKLVLGNTDSLRADSGITTANIMIYLDFSGVPLEELPKEITIRASCLHGFQYVTIDALEEGYTYENAG